MGAMAHVDDIIAAVKEQLPPTKWKKVEKKVKPPAKKRKEEEKREKEVVVEPAAPQKPVSVQRNGGESEHRGPKGEEEGRVAFATDEKSERKSVVEAGASESKNGEKGPPSTPQEQAQSHLLKVKDKVKIHPDAFDVGVSVLALSGDGSTWQAGRVVGLSLEEENAVFVRVELNDGGSSQWYGVWVE